MDAESMKTLLDTYEELTNVPTPEMSRIQVDQRDTGYATVTSYWSNQDARLGTKNTRHSTAFVQLPTADDKGRVIHHSFEPMVDTDSQHHVYSGSNRFSCTLSKGKKASDTKSRQYIRVFDHERAVNVCSKDMSLVKAHGTILHSADIGRLQWSNGEGHVLYVAAKHYEQTGFFDVDFGTLAEDEQEEKLQTLGSKYEYRQSWGEQLTECVQPVLCVLDVAALSVTTLTNIPANIHPTQAIWSPDDKGVVFVGLDASEELLGRIYCFNRKSSIYYYELKTTTLSELSERTEQGLAVTNPVFSPDGRTLLWAQRDCGGPHNGPAKLIKYDWSSSQVTVVLDLVKGPLESDDQFAGLETGGTAFVNRCWAADNTRFVCTTAWRSFSEIIVVDTSARNSISRITNIGGMYHGSWTLMDVSGDSIVASCSAPTRPPKLLVARLPAAGSEASIVWLRIETSSSPLDGHQLLSAANWNVLAFRRPPAAAEQKQQYLDAQYEAILTIPAIEAAKTSAPTVKLPLIVVPHGGPHSVCTASWTLSNALYLTAGYATLLVNYRGSIGFGDSANDSLCGRVGTQDVLDCHHAVRTAIDGHPELDGSKVFIAGGSHGGFLGAHLAGQYPDAYTAVVLRNPVIDMAAMFSVTDIPQWNVYEALRKPWKQSLKLTTDDLTQLRNMSPVAHAERVKAPHLLMLGRKDARVPPHVEEYRRILQANGVVCSIMSFPESNHAIDGVEQTTENLLNTIRFFEKFL